MIKRGDVVDVVLWIGETGGESFTAEVVYMPQATGDSWILKRPNGDVHHVQQFVQIVKYKPLTPPRDGGEDE